MCFHHAAGSQPTRSVFKQDRNFCTFILLKLSIITIFLNVGTWQKSRQQCKTLQSQLSSARSGNVSYSQEFFSPSCIILILISRKQRLSSWHYPLPLKFSLMVACPDVCLTLLSMLCPKFLIPKMNQCSLSPVAASCWDAGLQNKEWCLPQW